MKLFPDQLLSFRATLLLEPPPVTHHSKKRSRWGGMHDTPELVAAKESLAFALMATGRRPPRPLGANRGSKLGPPVVMVTEFVFGGADRWQHQRVAPDADNLNKTLQDVLAKAGWIATDGRVTAALPTKWKKPGRGFIRIQAIELDIDRCPQLSLVIPGGAVLPVGPSFDDLLEFS